MWMAGLATFLLLLYFYSGGVVHRYHGWEIGTLGVSVFCSFFTILRPPFLFLHLFYNELLLATERKGDEEVVGCVKAETPLLGGGDEDEEGGNGSVVVRLKEEKAKGKKKLWAAGFGLFLAEGKGRSIEMAERGEDRESVGCS
ncbi:hypothetical protein Peur_041723 [Populus x canadensis]